MKRSVVLACLLFCFSASWGLGQDVGYQDKIYLHLPHVHQATEKQQAIVLKRLEADLKNLPGFTLERKVYIFKDLETAGAIRFDPTKGKLSDVLLVLNRIQLPNYQQGDPLAIINIPASASPKVMGELSFKKKPQGVGIAQMNRNFVWLELTTSANASYPDMVKALQELNVKVLVK